MPHNPSTDETAVARLRAALIEADYTVEAVNERIGDAGQAALGRNSTVASGHALGAAADPLATLIRLFILQTPVPAADLDRALPGCVDFLTGEEIVALEGGTARALIDLRPYGSADDGASGWVVADLGPGLDSVSPQLRSDHVLGLSPASTSLAQLTIRGRVGRALDLGSGCGVQTLHLARHCDEVVATDLNPRANQLAALTFALNQVDADQRLGSLYEPVATEKFDLIVTNPPYVMSPPRADSERLTYREGNFSGDGLMAEVVTGAPEHLNPGGVLQVLGNWAITDPDNWTARIRDWIPDGCDALVMERERLDIYEYIEIWLADAGLLGTEEYLPRYREWVDYFDSLGIVAVGMGWLTLRVPEVPTSGHLRAEQWPHAVQQPVGPAFADHLAGVAALRTPEGKDLTDDEILATRWLLADDIITESLGTPGQPDPNHIVYRQQRGFRRAVEVDTALGGVLGACDGELTLGQITAAVAGLLDADTDALQHEIVGRVRELVTESMLSIAP